MNRGTEIQISPIARSVTTADGKAILEVAGQPSFELNPVAAAIWADLTQGVSPHQIISRLTKKFSAPEERLTRDVNSFIEVLKANHLAKDRVWTADFHVELVWNKGIAARCDWRIPDEFAFGTGFCTLLDPVGHTAPPDLLDNLISDPETYFNIKDGDLVWVKLSWIRSFLRQVLPYIKSKFILITADSVLSVPTSIMAEALEILDHPSVIHWYAQNCDGPGFQGRMSPLPLGIDFHSVSERPIWGENTCSPQEQEQILEAIRHELPPLTKRIRKVYVDFAWQPAHLYHPAKRKKVIRDLLTNECVVFQSKPLARTQLWRKWGEYAFVLSPHGLGLDCHRTWEALACGNVVLVPSSPLDSLYEGLPVIPIKDWKEITPENLQAWLERQPGCSLEEERLRSSYWVRKMRARAAEHASSIAGCGI